MASKYPRVDLSGLKTMSIADRRSKVGVSSFGRPVQPAASVAELLDSLPDILAGSSLKTIIDRIAAAANERKPIVMAMGAHVIKCGLSPFVCDLIRRGIITTVAMNGAGAIHDSEIALFGGTSEDVVEGMRSGMFGMARETAEFVNSGAALACEHDMGLGESLGKALLDAGAPHRDVSILSTAYESDVPVTVHVSIGSDIVHQHVSASGANIGAASMTDFRILTEAMKGLGQGGVLMNVGSAVVLPEVLLKALNTIINLGHTLEGMTGVNLDFVQQYRSNQQVVARVREIGGEGISLTGHHELMLPLITAGVIEQMECRGH